MRRAVIFDLDGTLLDSLEDLADAVNAGLEAFGYKPHPCSAYKVFVGDGLETLVKRALPQNIVNDIKQDDLKQLTEHVRKIYGAAWNVKSRPYAGIEKMLEILNKREDLLLGVLSNKPHFWTLEIVKHYFSAIKFTIVCGAKDHIPLKPHPAAALAIAEGLGLTTDKCYFVGDSDIDIRTAVNAKMNSIGVTWGFRGEQELRAEGAQFIAYTPEDILKVLD